MLWLQGGRGHLSGPNGTAAHVQERTGGPGKGQLKEEEKDSCVLEEHPSHRELLGPAHSRKPWLGPLERSDSQEEEPGSECPCRKCSLRIEKGDLSPEVRAHPGRAASGRCDPGQAEPTDMDQKGCCVSLGAGGCKVRRDSRGVRVSGTGQLRLPRCLPGLACEPGKGCPQTD